MTNIQLHTCCENGVNTEMQMVTDGVFLTLAQVLVCSSHHNLVVMLSTETAVY